MKHPKSLRRAIAHPAGERLERRPPSPPLAERPAGVPPSAADGQRRRQAATGRLLVATGSLVAAAGVALVIIGLPEAPEFLALGLPLMIAGTALQGSRLACRMAAALLCVLLLPALLAIALAVRLTSPGPVLVRGDDAGREGPAATLRFRTTVRAEAPAGRTTTVMRLTTVGGVLRRLWLDELPSLLDVIRGRTPHPGARSS